MFRNPWSNWGRPFAIVVLWSACMALISVGKKDVSPQYRFEIGDNGQQ